MPEKEKGRWVTIRGTHVFIKEGESVEDAIEKLKRKRMFYATSNDGLRKFIPEGSEPEEGWAISRDDRFHEAINEALDWIEDADYQKPFNMLYKEMSRKFPGLGFAMTDFRNELADRKAAYGERLAREYLAGVPKHKDMLVEESIQNTNPHYRESRQAEEGSAEWYAYQNNCQRCVAAFALRFIYGYDVEAAPCDYIPISKTATKNGPSNDKLYNYKVVNGYYDWALCAFDAEDVKANTLDGGQLSAMSGRTSSSSSVQKKQIARVVKKAGPGACYIVKVVWQGGHSAHDTCVINDNGEVKFVDPQTGRSGPSWEDYVFGPGSIRPRYTKITRVDKCRLNGQVMKEMIKK